MKKLIKQLAVFLIKLANKRKEFKITESIIKVKKGTRRYTVAYFETKTGKTKVTVSRHIEKKVKESLLN